MQRNGPGGGGGGGGGGAPPPPPAPLVPPDTLYYLQDLQTQRRAKVAPHPFESAQSG
ncbi:hypothetical protein GW636_23300, partial [Serratia marcescens]|nr:hypothetical protein [Serratia marcescens]